MKTTKIKVFPHLMADSYWQTTVSLKNIGVATEPVEITLKRNTKVVKAFYSVPAFSSINLDNAAINLLLEAGTAPFSLTVVSSEYVVPHVGLYTNDQTGIKFWAMMTPEDMTGKPVVLSYASSCDMSLNQNWHLFYGQSDGRFLRQAEGGVLLGLFAKDRINSGLPHKLVVGDCARYDGSDLFGHPAGSHPGVMSSFPGCSFDLNYPRYDGGYTQYRPSGTIATPIFNDNGEILLNYFDHSRFMGFINSLRSYFPNMVCRVDQRVKTALEGIYGTMSWMQHDGIGTYDHDKHCHIALGYINTEGN